MPFQPAWRATVGPHQFEGRGTLSGPARELWEGIGVFEVAGLTVIPLAGEVQVGNTVKIKTLPGRLAWYRRMVQHVPTNHSPDCQWYGVGIENSLGLHGFKVFEDGRILEGID